MTSILSRGRWVKSEMVQVVEILSHGRQLPVCSAYWIPWLLMTWWYEVPGHQKSWCLSNHPWRWQDESNVKYVKSQTANTVSYSKYVNKEIKKNQTIADLTYEHLQTHRCILSTVDTDALVLKHQTISTCWLNIHCMMTSSNGDIFCVTGHLCGEFTGPQWIPRTKASDAELFSLICVWINNCVNNREAGDLRRYRTHYDVIIMALDQFHTEISYQ